MPSDLIPAPELDYAAVRFLLARARRYADAPAGSPVTLPAPLSTLDLAGVARLEGMVQRDRWRPCGQAWRNEWRVLPPVAVPRSECWSLYGLADLSEHNHLAGVRLMVLPELPDPRESWDCNLLQVFQPKPSPEQRQPRLGYLMPPVWLDPGTTFRFEVLGGGGDDPSILFPVAITLVGYRGPAA